MLTSHAIIRLMAVESTTVLRIRAANDRYMLDIAIDKVLSVLRTNTPSLTKSKTVTESLQYAFGSCVGNVWSLSMSHENIY